MPSWSGYRSSPFDAVVVLCFSLAADVATARRRLLRLDALGK
jgi:hypothetical protein